jgi:AcrR family transcriptional regulator
VSDTGPPDVDLAEAGADGPDDETETKGERTRRRILELAIEHFGRKGMRATSVTEITRAVGLTQAASYAYFDSKVELFRAAVDADVESLIGSVMEPLEQTPIDQLLPSVLVFFASKLDEHPLAVRVLRGQEPDAAASLADLPALLEVRRQLARRLHEAQTAGEIRSDVDVEALAVGLQVVLLALLTSLVMGGGAGGPEGTGSGAALPPDDVVLGVLTVFDAVLRPPA